MALGQKGVLSREALPGARGSGLRDHETEPGGWKRVFLLILVLLSSVQVELPLMSVFTLGVSGPLSRRLLVLWRRDTSGRNLTRLSVR